MPRRSFMVEWSSLAEEESVMWLLKCLVLAKGISFWTFSLFLFIDLSAWQSLWNAIDVLPSDSRTWPD